MPPEKKSIVLTLTSERMSFWKKLKSGYRILVQGYRLAVPEEYATCAFGLARETLLMDDGKRKLGKKWTVTNLRTGRRVGRADCTSRAEAVAAANAYLYRNEVTVLSPEDVVAAHNKLLETPTAPERLAPSVEKRWDGWYALGDEALGPFKSKFVAEQTYLMMEAK